MPYRVLHTECSGGWAGQERRVLLECEEMRKRGHTLVLACEMNSPLAREARKRGFDVHELHYRRGCDFASIRRVRRLIGQERVDLVNTHSSKDAWVGGLAALGTRARVVRTRHLSIPVKPNARNRLLYARLTHRIVTTGAALRDQLVTENGFAPERIVSVPTGVDLSVFDPCTVTPAPLREQYGLPANAMLTGVVAMLRAMKGHAVLIDAMPRIIAQFPSVYFLFFGEAPPESPLPRQYAERAAELGVIDRIVFAGYRDDVPSVLAALDCVVLPSTRDEGVPQSMTQALAMRRPVVATDVGATGEVVRNEETGLLVPPGDTTALAEAVIRVLRNPGEAAVRAETGRALIEREYSAARMAERMESVYADLLGATGVAT